MPGAGYGSVRVSAIVSGLSAGVTYPYRVLAGNTGGVSYGAIEQLTTASAGAGTRRRYVELATTTLQAHRNGTLVAVLHCRGSRRCEGTIALRALAAAIPPARHAVLLAHSSFTAPSSGYQRVVLRLSSAGLGLLGRSHVLRAQARISSGPRGARPSAVSVWVTIRGAAGGRA
jgi:hypothetical protein